MAVWTRLCDPLVNFRCGRVLDSGLASTWSIGMTICPRLPHRPRFGNTAMGLLLLAGLAFSLLTSLPSAAAPTLGSVRLRVMSFNVRLPVDSDGANRWEARRELMAEVVAGEDPDLIGTQELFQTQGEDLVARLPQYAWFGRGRLGGGPRDEHMGVFYRKDRLRLLESGDFWLSDTPESVGSITWGNLYPRMVTWARFERIADGATFVFYNTHLPYREEDEPIRERGAALILARLRQVPADEPIILAGDFNTVPGSPTHRLLTADLRDAWTTATRRKGPAATFHNFTGQPDRRIDWILFRGGLQLKSATTVTTHRGELYPSDHFPVVVDFQLRKPGK
jgi:endonuclease/exonuclease/phosphatase family metal-dependent hydrolase